MRRPPSEAQVYARKENYARFILYMMRGQLYGLRRLVHVTELLALDKAIQRALESQRRLQQERMAKCPPKKLPR